MKNNSNTKSFPTADCFEIEPTLSRSLKLSIYNDMYQTEDAESLKQQILENQEKAKKWDKHTQIYTHEMYEDFQKAEEIINKLKDFYICQYCRHISRLDEIGKNSELRMCPKCDRQMESFKFMLEKLEQ